MITPPSGYTGLKIGDKLQAGDQTYWPKQKTQLIPVDPSEYHSVIDGTTCGIYHDKDYLYVRPEQKKISGLLLIIGAPVTENFERAQKVAEALGYNWSRTHVEYLKQFSVCVAMRWGSDSKNAIGIGMLKQFGDITRFNIIDLRSFDKTTSIKLTENYTAVIAGDDVKVGCQTFDGSVVRELTRCLR